MITGNSSYIGARDPREAARLAAQEAGGLAELRAALALHPVPPDARVLELGCGAGTFTHALVAALPDATITATDVDDTLLAAARTALAPAVRAGRLSFAHADAASLPYPARAFDLVACRCLLMHQPDPLLVVAEMFRVLAVGGTALAVEPDWGARALYPDSQALAELLELAHRARPFGFPDLQLGRTLFALFRAAGFIDIRIHPAAFSETADDLTTPGEAVANETVVDEAEQAERTEPTGPARLIQQGRALMRQAGADDASLDALIERLQAIPRHPEYFSAGLDFSVAASKPAPPLSP